MAGQAEKLKKNYDSRVCNFVLLISSPKTACSSLHEMNKRRIRDLSLINLTTASLRFSVATENCEAIEGSKQINHKKFEHFYSKDVKLIIS